MFNFLKYRKSSLLRKRKISTRAMILDKEISIEVFWKILNELQDKVEEVKAKIVENTKQMKAEEKKTPMSMDIIKALNSENIELGWTTEKDKNGNVAWKGKVFSLMQQANYYHTKINEVVGAREYLKIQLKAIDRMIETGYMKHFEEILEAEAQISFKGKKK